MNIVLLTNQDLASNVAANLLLPSLQEHNVTIGLSSKVGGKQPKNAALQRLAFVEQMLFNDIVSPLLEGKKSGESQFKPFSELTSQPVVLFNHINSAEGIAQLSQMQPDLIISIRFGKILKSPVLAVPKIGVLNLHSGLLPDYRGVMASFWALLNGEQELGTTLHWIEDASIDTGAIVATSKLKVAAEKSYLWHVLQLYFGGCPLILDAVNRLSLGKSLNGEVQHGEGAYFSFPSEQDIAQLEKQGFALLNEQEVVEFYQTYYLELISGPL
ncbi:MAG: formyl transferase [Aestuariibacter sp.]